MLMLPVLRTPAVATNSALLNPQARLQISQERWHRLPATAPAAQLLHERIKLPRFSLRALYTL